jgi:hypothetical protein
MSKHILLYTDQPGMSGVSFLRKLVSAASALCPLEKSRLG